MPHTQLGQLYVGEESHLALMHSNNPAAKILIKRLAYAKANPQGKDIDNPAVAGPLFLSNEWLMDEANGRGEANGYEPLADQLYMLTSEPDYLSLPFTNSYDDRGKKAEWVVARPAAARAEAEAEAAQTAAAEAAAEVEDADDEDAVQLIDPKELGSWSLHASSGYHIAEYRGESLWWDGAANGVYMLHDGTRVKLMSQ